MLGAVYDSKPGNTNANNNAAVTQSQPVSHVEGLEEASQAVILVPLGTVATQYPVGIITAPAPDPITARAPLLQKAF